MKITCKSCKQSLNFPSLFSKSEKGCTSMYVGAGSTREGLACSASPPLPGLSPHAFAEPPRVCKLYCKYMQIRCQIAQTAWRNMDKVPTSCRFCRQSFLQHRKIGNTSHRLYTVCRDRCKKNPGPCEQRTSFTSFGHPSMCQHSQVALSKKRQ